MSDFKILFNETAVRIFILSYSFKQECKGLKNFQLKCRTDYTTNNSDERADGRTGRKQNIHQKGET